MLGLALSGGGFRATLFHAGSLLRLNEAGLLPEIDEITSVSGGSIIAAHLGLNWSGLNFNDQNVATNFGPLIVDPIREFCSRKIDVGVIVGGILNPIRHPSHGLIKNYRKFYGATTLQDLPASGAGPHFTIYATSLQTGVSVRFCRDYLGDYHLGKIPDPDIQLAVAVAASSAFPPPLCPVKLKVNPDAWVKGRLSDLHDDPILKKTMWLADGGIYDNLGLERLSQKCDRILVSDAGAPFDVNRKLPAARFSQLARTKRTLDIMGAQTRALRARGLIRQFERGDKRGTYWGIGTKIAKYPIHEQGLPPLISDSDQTDKIADMRTRLNKFKKEEQVQLINWGFALADSAMRSYFEPVVAEVGGLPLPMGMA